MAAVGVKDIKRRRKSIENTMKITKAMELVAFSKLRKSSQKVKQTQPFFNEIYDFMANISNMNDNIDSQFFNTPFIKKRCYIVIAGDRGLAGNYNGNLLRYSEDQLKTYNKNDILIVSIGKKATNYFRRRNYNIYCHYDDISENVNTDLASNIAKELLDGFINEYQEIYVIYTNFISVLVQEPNIKKILPLSFGDDTTSKKFSNIIYDPSPKKVLDIIVPQYITGILYGTIVESFAAEQGARRIAMEAASKNAKEMLQDINVMFNKVRQTNITQEITEISAGARAN